LNETCAQGAPGCEPFNPSFTVANDWLHSNSVQYTPYDGNLILSMRNQDWVIKVSYTNGSGDGHVIWRLGAGGNFAIGTQGTTGVDVGSPWFSHQHDANFALNGTAVNGALLFTVFDDGNTRRADFNSNADSRCQVYAMNEASRSVNLNVNIDVLSYSAALGSAQLLLTGNLHCNSGFINGFVAGKTNAIESQQDGTIIYNLSTPVLTYRSFRQTNMYSPDFP
jgi:arylsulfate sulfotransferase